MDVETVDISLVVPLYNESESVDVFFREVLPFLKKTKRPFEILCINDGSSDDTLEKLIKAKKKYSQIKIIDFSRNFGKDAAITAGLDYANGKCVIPMDCDLQDPPKLIAEMIKKWEDGFEVVLAKRSDRSREGFFKRITAKMFYRVFNYISDPQLPEDVGDFRLIDRKVVDILKKFPERKRFMKGLFAFAGFETTSVEYKRPEREKGQTKWHYWKLWNYAIDGITSFSIFPLRIWTYFGLFITLLAFGRAAWIFVSVLIYGIDVPGYASQVVAMLFLSGVQLIGLGLVGEYVGRIYEESKHRPIYIVKNVIN
jgi:glycosyltransferase involved in cell wall biosynthesis